MTKKRYADLKSIGTYYGGVSAVRVRMWLVDLGLMHRVKLDPRLLIMNHYDFKKNGLRRRKSNKTKYAYRPTRAGAQYFDQHSNKWELDSILEILDSAGHERKTEPNLKGTGRNSDVTISYKKQ